MPNPTLRMLSALAVFLQTFGSFANALVVFSAAKNGGKAVGLLSEAAPATKASWMDRVHQLIEYRNEHGNTLVPKRYPPNPALGNWVNKQRQHYRKFLMQEAPSSFSDEKVQILNDIGFCWDGTTKVTDFQQEAWLGRLEELKQVYGSLAEKDLNSSLMGWLRQQRKEFRKYRDGHESKLDANKISALNDVDPHWWKTARERQWDTRFCELMEYRSAFGNCCVPIHYENRKLAHWVSNIRKSYKAKLSGETSTLSEDQIQRLKAIGFVWNRWDYEFEKRYDE